MNTAPNKPENDISPDRADASETREDDLSLSEEDTADGAQKDEHAAVTDGTFVYAVKRFGKAAWAYIKHARIELIVAAALLILDLVTKAIVARTMYVGQSITVLPDFLYISYVRNTKAAFGKAFGLEKALGDNGIRIVFLIITIFAVGVFCWLLYRCRRRHILMRVSLALIISGALGNFFDRLFLHYVRDFVEIVFFGADLPLLGKSFAIFNIADVALTVGVILFLVYFLFIYREPKNKSEDEQAQVSDDVAAEEKSETIDPAQAANGQSGDVSEDDATHDEQIVERTEESGGEGNDDT